MTSRWDHDLIELLKTGPAVLATVVQVRGSVPREVGARMVVNAQGQIWGTIGGGAGEAKVIRQALEALSTGISRSIEIDLTGASHQETQGVCGGIMRVWLGYWEGEAALAIAHRIQTTLNQGKSLTLITPLNPDQVAYVVDSPPHILPANSFTETLQPRPTLLIVGAGHVGEQLAKTAASVGFQIVVQDDRAEWANSQRYPQADRLFNDPIAVALKNLAHHSQLYVALVTRGYQYDLEALEALLNRSIHCQYIGMIGSEKRIRQVYEELIQQGFPDVKLRSIYAPIGLDIGALSPEEIAVSIAAELILVRRGGTGKPLSHLRQSKVYP
ncbi:MAG: XdhC/CoxI family protein [Leptolyngbyaceae cyanobacterium bins.59]|nr:XdhC/CoxI family protein [Leptolyngbyaceae cyanobacterium bins.59]